MDDRRFVEVELDGGGALVWVRGEVEEATAAVLLLHDRAMNARAWDPVMRRMPSGTALIAPDLRGRGSAWRLPPSRGIESHVADLADLLHQLDIDHVVVAGHGLGAAIAREFRRLVPDRVVMSVGILGSGPDPFRDVLGSGFPDRVEHRRHWERHPALAGISGDEAVEGFIAHGIAGAEEHHRWRVDLRSLIADDASAEALMSDLSPDPASSFTRSIVICSSLADDPEHIAGSTSQLVGADPATVVLTPTGADAIAALIRPLLSG